MKKIILTMIISILLFGGDNNLTTEITLSEKIKETNDTTVISVRKVIIDSFNSFMPSYLQVQPKENFLDVALTYDLLHNSLKTSVKVRVILPSVERSVTKIKENSDYTETKKTYTFKISPLLRIYKSTPTLVIRPSFTYTETIENFFSTISKDFSFNETFYYYTGHNEFKEVTTLKFNKVITIKNLTFKASKTIYSYDRHNIYYNAGFYYYDTYSKFIRVYGLTADGNTPLKPFFQSYKLFFTYRMKLFNKNYLYAEITPYLLFSKDWNFKGKFYATSSIHLKF